MHFHLTCPRVGVWLAKMERGKGLVEWTTSYQKLQPWWRVCYFLNTTKLRMLRNFWERQHLLLSASPLSPTSHPTSNNFIFFIFLWLNILHLKERRCQVAHEFYLTYRNVRWRKLPYQVTSELQQVQFQKHSFTPEENTTYHFLPTIFLQHH